MKKEVKEIRYENDLWQFINIRNKNNSQYKKLKKIYNEFLKCIKADHNIVRYPDINTAFLFNQYFKNKKSDFEFMFKSLVEVDIGFNLEEINDLALDIANSQNVNKSLYRKIKSYKDIIKITEEIINSKNLSGLMVWLYVLNFELSVYLSRLTSIMKFVEEAYQPFISYYNLVINKKAVPDDLVDKIIKLTAHSTFATINNNIKFGENKKENLSSFLDYKIGFLEYTNKHNESLNHINVAKFEIKKTNKPQKEETITISKSYDINEIIIKQDNEKDKLIKNYVDSYFEVLSSSLHDNVENFLPNPSIGNYDKIMVGLLERYEEYLTKLAQDGNCTMADNHIYYVLDAIVSNIKS